MRPRHPNEPTLDEVLDRELFALGLEGIIQRCKFCDLLPGVLELDFHGARIFLCEHCRALWLPTHPLVGEVVENASESGSRRRRRRGHA